MPLSEGLLCTAASNESQNDTYARLAVMCVNTIERHTASKIHKDEAIQEPSASKRILYAGSFSYQCMTLQKYMYIYCCVNYPRHVPHNRSVWLLLLLCY